MRGEAEGVNEWCLVRMSVRMLILHSSLWMMTSTSMSMAMSGIISIDMNLNRRLNRRLIMMMIMSLIRRLIMSLIRRLIPRRCRSGQVVLRVEMHRRQRLGVAHLRIHRDEHFDNND